MGHRAIDYITPDAYLQMENEAVEKHEYFDGQIHAMAGASYNHNFIVGNLLGEIKSFLKGKSCNAFPSDLRVTTPLFSSYMYPDVSIVCGQAEFQPDSFDTLVNPSVIFEVMSPSTMKLDFGKKLLRYLQIPSIEEIIFVDSSEYYVRIISKEKDATFRIADFSDIDSAIFINAISMELSMKDIYYGVSIDENRSGTFNRE
jgi:Uma2 family endonuclease